MAQRTFTIVVQVPNTEMDDATMQNQLQILLNNLVDDSLITLTTHVDSE